MASIVEVVIFDVKKKRTNEFYEAMKHWVEFLKNQPGFISYNYLSSIENPRYQIQILEFEDKETARRILDNYHDSIGHERFEAFFRLLNKKPILEYYEKVDYIKQ